MRGFAVRMKAGKWCMQGMMHVQSASRDVRAVLIFLENSGSIVL